MTYNGLRLLRRGIGMTVSMVGVTILFALVAYGAYRGGGWNWVSIGMGLVAAVIGVGSIVESLVLRIELTDDAMVVTDWTGRKQYPRGDIERISEEKGGPPALRMNSGTWVKLPSVGSDLGNSVRAWLKRH